MKKQFLILTLLISSLAYAQVDQVKNIKLSGVTEDATADSLLVWNGPTSPLRFLKYSTIQSRMDAHYAAVLAGVDNWNTAFGWGNHALAGYSTGAHFTWDYDYNDLINKPTAIGDVLKSGMPVDNQVAVWTSDAIIEGDTDFTFNTANNLLTLGLNDTTNGTLYLRGSATGASGTIALFNPADFDSDTDAFVIGNENGTGNFILREWSGSSIFYHYNPNTNVTRFPYYGDGTKTGTATYNLAVDTDGNIIETALGGGTDDQTATEVPFTPYSTIAATNVQTAIQEVLDEASAGGNLQAVTDLGNSTTNSFGSAASTGQVYASYDVDPNVYTIIQASASGAALRIGNSSGVEALFKADNLTSTRTHQAPDANGTYALQEWVTAQGYSTSSTTINNTLTSTSTTEAASANTVKTLKDLHDTQQTAIDLNTAKVSFDWDYDYTDLINKPTIPTSLAAANITVSPSIGGEIDAYAVMLANRTSIDSIKANFPNTAMPIEQKLNNWFTALKESPSTATMAFVGDSTSDLVGNATSLITAVGSWNEPGEELEDFDTANMPNYGSSGQTIVGFIANAGSKGLADVASANLDLVIFSYGINDVRQNNLTKDQLKNHIITCIDSIKSGSPNTDIILRMPNSFDIPADDFYIKQGGYASLAEAAQAQSDILYTAYKELEFYWEDVVLFNTQDLLYGRISTPEVSYLHSDEIHPRYGEMVEILVRDFIGIKGNFIEEAAERAISISSTPWTIYPKVFEKEPEYINVGSGSINAQGVGYLYVGVGTNNGYKVGQEDRYGDYISINDGEMVIRNTIGLGTLDANRVSYGASLPANSYPNGTKVEFFRARYNNQEINSRYQNDKLNFPYARRVRIGTGTSGYFNIQTILDDDIITPETKGLTPVLLNMTTSDVVVFEDGTELPLTGATFSDVSNNKRVTITGDYTSYTNTVAFIYSNKEYESFDDLANITTSATIQMNGYTMYNDQTDDASTITLSDCQAGESLTVYINRASVPTLAGTGLTFNQLPNTMAFAADTEMAIYFEVAYDGTTIDYFYYER